MFHQVESSFIKAIAYSRKHRVLKIEFTSGSVYQYFGVSRHRHDRLMTAESTGRYFNAHIRSKYEYELM